MNALVWLTPEMSTRVCVTLLHSLWQVAALVAFAWLAGCLWRKRSVERAYVAHVAALLLSVACGPITFLLTGTPPGLSDVPTTSLAETPPVVVHQPSETPVVSPIASNAGIAPVATAPPADKDTVRADAPVAGAGVGPGLDGAVVWRKIARWLAGCYAAGVGVMLIRLAVGVASAERLRGRSRPVIEGPLAEALRRLADTWSLRVVPGLAMAEPIVVPKVVGLIKPTILIPASALTGLSPDQVEMILAHELAHVLRYDMWVNLVQRLAEAALFFNPALWVLSRRISSLREYCCDELACGGTQPRDEDLHVRYAQALLRVVELSQTTPKSKSGIAVLAASGRSPSELRRRVARLFGEPLREPLQLSRGALLPLSLLAAVMVAQPVLNTWADNSDSRLSVSENQIRLHVVGPDGDPIPNVEVEIRAQPSPTAEQIPVGEWLRGSRYGVFTKTDEQGQLAIRFDEPPTRLAFSVRHSGYGPYWAEWDSTNHAEALPNQFTMPLEKAWTVGGIVTDEQGVPVEGARVRPSISLTHAYPAHLVRIEADGYQVAVSRDIMTDEGQVDLDFELRRAANIAATIVTQSGEPAAGAKIALGVAGSQISIEGGDVDDGSTYATRLEADSDGRFSIPALDEPFQLVITHDSGFAHLKSEDGPISDRITLTPWARVEGTFRVGPEPASNVVLSLYVEGIHSYGEGVPHIFTSHDVTTGKDGNFVFERVFPGAGRIGRGILLMVDDGATEVTSSQRVSAEFISGKTTRLDLGGTGRPVIGRLAPSTDYHDKVYWNFALVNVQADLKAPPQPEAPAEIQNAPEKYKAWWKEWKDTTEGQAWSAAYAAYEQLKSQSPYITASVDRDGSFRIDDMLPGDYVLGVRFSKFSAGKLSGFRFTVPGMQAVRSDETLDLGVLTLESTEPTAD